MNPLPDAPDFAAAHAAVRALCDHFDAERADFTNDSYKEAEARAQFITPFFKALGWDVDNAARRSVYEKDVVVEKRQDLGGSALSADYAFRRPGSHLTAFFVEAKKPGRDIRNHQDCYQAVQYGWNAKTPLVVLTNFAQLFVLDARSEPDDHNSTRFILRQGGGYASRDYRDPEKFAELWGLLARANVAAGSLDKAAAALPRLSGRLHRDDLFARGSGPVDDTFLAEMEGWREHLAKQLKKDNHSLDGERLTALTQRILDRLVFLRFLEDRGIEREVTFAAIGRGGSAWGDFLKVSARLNARYNGIIYKPDPSGCEDRTLAVDDVVFAGVARRFAPENSKYLFNSISVTILGSIYERFLGNVIVARHKTAIVEPKPEVRKAGGVYYTPDYIVRYIVEQTVGRAIAGKKPDDIARLRFADIACGSGSFLVEVFACLIRYHLKWYLADGAAKWAKKGDLRARERDDEYVLTLAAKRRLLLNNVYGVDLDPQAVEVTQLSLYLRLMEDESFPSTQLLFDEERRALLPSLAGNILCGNSIIGTDIRDLLGLTDEEEERVKPLDLNDRFDTIVGNPPYIRIQTLRDIIPQTPGYCGEHYAAATGNYDIYVVFVERGASLLKPGGRLGYIVPNKFFRTDYGEGLRGSLSKRRLVERIVDFGHSQVFDATTYTSIIVLNESGVGSFAYGEAEANAESLAQVRFDTVAATRLTNAPWVFAEDAASKLLEKLVSGSTTLLGLGITMNRGSSTGDDEVFIVPEATDLEPETVRIAVHATDFSRYTFTPRAGKRLLFPYDAETGQLHSERVMAARYPKAYAYLAAWKTRLKQRKQFTKWFGYSAPWSLKTLDAAQIAVPLLANRGLGALIPQTWQGQLCFMASGGFTLAFPAGVKADPTFILGLINSKLLFWCLRQSSNLFRGGWITCTKQYFGELPIKNIGALDEARHDKLIKAVEKLHRAKTSENEATVDFRREYWHQQIAALDRQIDALVYELYGLSEDEIALVEGEG